jgi:hypothetical protein
VIRFLVAGVKHALGLHHPGPTLLLRPADVFLVSYPKSGNTWARFLLGNLMHPEEPATFANIHRMVPDPGATSKREFDRLPNPRIIKSHECFDPHYPRVIYVVRDPRDVVLSQYHYNRKIKRIADDSPIETFVTRFLAGEINPHGSWGESVTTWLVTREGDPRFLLLRYEDMIADTARELQKVAAFLGLKDDPPRIASAVELSTAGRMRKLEADQNKDSAIFRGSRKDLFFVRAARAGGWRNELPTAQVERIEAAWGRLMHHLGYELNSPSHAEATESGAPGILDKVLR